ncbi:hypothetical protein NOCA270074 [metagenome]|uniref:Uncharacterized protein n=1 Tax=metagenome TaxID=256318 RepID=A0A2P2CDS3_9ZZZZ
MGAHRQRPRRAQRIGIEVGQTVDRDRAVLVVEQHRRADGVGAGADEHPRCVDQVGAEAEALGGVVVAAGDDHLRPRARESGEALVGEPNGVDRGEGPVVDVSGHDHEVDTLGLDHLQEVVDVRSLVAEQILSVEGPPQMPVRAVKDAHMTNLGDGTDSTAYPRRGCQDT